MPRYEATLNQQRINSHYAAARKKALRISFGLIRQIKWWTACHACSHRVNSNKQSRNYPG